MVDRLIKLTIQGSGIPGRSRPAFAGLLFTALVTLTLTSCTPFAPAARQGLEEAALPASFSVQDTMRDEGLRWWETFDDAQLDGFMDEALGGNQTLATYWARLERARAQARKAGADLLPSLSGEGGLAYRKTGIDSGSTTAGGESWNYSLGLVAGYEVDLWGRVRATHDSARLEAVASSHDLQAVAMTVTAEVAELWLSILSQKLQHKLLEQQLETNATYLELVELRFRKSLASALDVLQQKQLVERIKARIPLIEMQERLLKNRLTVLLGRMPNEVPEVTERELPVLKEVPAAGLPVQLLENRPDIAAALKRLESADLDLAAARADRLPSLRLSGSAAYESDELDRLFDNWFAGLAASLTGPLFDGSRRKAEVEVNRAAVEQALAEYRQTVLNAVREVEDGLISEQKVREHIGALENQLEASRKALVEARARYIKGLNDYLPVLTQLLTVQGLESDLIQRQEDLLVARVGLYRAIGGRWIDELPVQVKTN